MSGLGYFKRLIVLNMSHVNFRSYNVRPVTNIKKKASCCILIRALLISLLIIFPVLSATGFDET